MLWVGWFKMPCEEGLRNSVQSNKHFSDVSIVIERTSQICVHLCSSVVLPFFGAFILRRGENELGSGTTQLKRWNPDGGGVTDKF